MSLIRSDNNNKIYLFDKENTVFKSFVLAFTDKDYQDVYDDIINWFKLINEEFSYENYTDINIPALNLLGYKGNNLIDKINNDYLNGNNINLDLIKLAKENKTDIKYLIEDINNNNSDKIHILLDFDTNFVSRIYNSLNILTENKFYIDSLKVDNNKEWLYLLPQIFGFNIIIVDDELNIKETYDIYYYNEFNGYVIIQENDNGYSLIGIDQGNNKISTLFDENNQTIVNMLNVNGL